MQLTFREVVAAAIEWLRQDKRVSYRALKRQFGLDDGYLADLKNELIHVRRVASDEEDTVLVWAASSESQPGTLTEVAPRDAVSSPERPTPSAERRQLTVMFCDLVGSTPLSGRLDPEDLREVVRAYQQTCAEVVQRFDGHVRQFLGDALLVYFGWPRAHEDDAHRAVRAGLEMLEAMARLNTSLERDKGIGLAVRVGIHTGLVVVGEMGAGGHREHLALGQAPNIASRVQDRAEPNTVVISDATYRLVSGHFTVDAVGAHSLKGVAVPMRLYRVAGEQRRQSPDRMDMPGNREPVPLVGRESDLALLADRWAQSRQGQGQVVLLRGEAGIGKSRLVHALYEQVAGEGATRIVLRCSPYHTNSALYPVIEHLQQVLQVSSDDTDGVRVEKLERELKTSGVTLTETVPLLAALLTWPHPESYPPLDLNAQLQREKTQDIIVTWLLAAADRQPVLAVWEDLHWADASTLELLGRVLDQSPTAGILSVLTCRPEFHPPWSARAHLTQLTLNRLTRPQVIQVARRVAGGKVLPPDVMEQIVSKTDGVPLFVEEMTKAILESGQLRELASQYEVVGTLAPFGIPTTLQDSLMARLDRLVTAKPLAQYASVIGRHFSYAVLQAVSELDVTTLTRELERLIEAELVYQRGQPPHATYMFKHALIRDAAYASLLKRTRQQHHHRIAQVLEEQFPEVTASQPELLAHHYTEAGLNERAVDYWIRAGQNAVGRSANVEAVGQLARGLEVLEALPETTGRRRQELALRVALGPALIATKGYGAPEVHQTYTRARELCEQLEDTVQLFPVLRGLWNQHLMRADHRMARVLADQLLQLAERLQIPASLVEAHRVLGTVLWNQGELSRAHDHLQRGIALYDPRQHRSLALVYGADSGVVCRLYEGVVFWTLGYPKRAREAMHEALNLADELSHAHTVAFVRVFAAMLHRLCGDVRAAREQAEAVTVLATEQHIAQWFAAATILLGRVAAAEGHPAEGIARIREGSASWRAASAEVLRPVWLAFLAEAHGDGGGYEEGLGALDEALSLVATTGEHWYEAELLRLKGEMLVALSPERHTEVLACFTQAVEIARRQEARSWELRAAISLSRFWRDRGHLDKARDVLAPVYDWFTEGFDTTDLQAARAILQEVSEDHRRVR